MRVPREKLERYPVSLDALFAALAKANALTGKPRGLRCGLWLVGRRKSGATSTQVCLVPAGLRGPTRLLVEEAHQELSRASMAGLLPPPGTR